MKGLWELSRAFMLVRVLGYKQGMESVRESVT